MNTSVCRQRNWSGIFLVLIFYVAAFHSAEAQLIFSDGFETGDTSRWSVRVPLACPSGPAVAGSLAGDLGPAPAGSHVDLTCVEVLNDQSFERSGEVAFSGIAIPESLSMTSTDGLALIGPGDRLLASQFEVLARWAGPPDNLALPIRWLEVAVQPRVAANDRATYILRRYDSLASTPDPFTASITASGPDYIVDTGLATFTLDPASAALIKQISVDFDNDGSGRTTVYSHRPGAGPRLSFENGGAVVMGTSNAGVSVDPGGFQIVESGPVRVVVQLDGHFTAPGGASLCQPSGTGLSYERFGYTVAATFNRASRDVVFEVIVRNECSDGFGDSWTDDAVTVNLASWELPFSMDPLNTYVAGSAVSTSVSAFNGLTRVEQAKGFGNPWLRRASASFDESIQESAEAFDQPLVAAADSSLVVAVQMPWMRYREPQALSIDSRGAATTVSVQFISEPLIVGEGKGIWNFAKLTLEPVDLIPTSIETFLASESDLGTNEIERGLMVRPVLPFTNEARIFASLGTSASTPIKTKYLAVLGSIHDATVGPGGQWDLAHTYGSQLWPDTQFDQWWSSFPPDDPIANNGAMNYWNASGAELMEHLRSGEPRWFWDFARPQTLLQLHSAYLNLGNQEHGNRNGVAVTSGGSGEGHWHRSEFGSDDYTYTTMMLSYALRPSPTMRDRFAQAGRMVVDRYSIPQANQGDRERFVNQVDITRQVIQHYDQLANCAEFVLGQDGLACHNKLVELMTELVADNMRAEIMCQDDLPSLTLCGQPQKFMQNSLMYHFFHRYLLNYGDISGLQAMLVGDPLNHYNQGIGKLPDGISIDVPADWAALLECGLSSGGTVVDSCTWIDTGDGVNMLLHNKAQTVAQLLMAHDLDPSIDLCSICKTALDDPGLTDPGWDDYVAPASGWWKGSSQMMQGAVFAVGLYDTCVDP